MAKMQIEAIKTNIITSKDRINDVIIKSLQGIKNLEGSVIVIASKIVAITQNRIEKIESEADFDRLVTKEADVFLGGRQVKLTLKDNIFAPWAGIDKSNIEEGMAVLWPIYSFKVAESIKNQLKKEYGLNNIGVIITDSFCAPLRDGVIAVAIGYAGFKGVKDFRGKEDLHGNKMQYSRHAIADGLATAATIIMGETNEQTPIALISGAPIEFTNETIDPNESIMDPADCLYAPIYPDSINKN